jgi:hypothetical protein
MIFAKEEQKFSIVVCYQYRDFVDLIRGMYDIWNQWGLVSGCSYGKKAQV